MSTLLNAAMTLSAALFIAVSATMNALFLSSLGRTPVEVALLAAVSIAADVVKAALPVVIVRAVIMRAWVHTGIAAVMLIVVVALSLASGTGFAALTRSGATAARQAHADDLAARQREIRELEVQIDALPPSPPTSVIEAELAASQSNWRWTATKSCAAINTVANEKFCASVFKLRTALASSTERDRLTAERRATRARIEALQAVGASTDSDPQASAIAALLGVDPSTPRRVLTTSLAVVLELGSVILALLVAGPALLGWREQGIAPKPPPQPAEIPPSPDRAHWQRQRNKANLDSARGEGHARTQ